MGNWDQMSIIKGIHLDQATAPAGSIAAAPRTLLDDVVRGRGQSMPLARQHTARRVSGMHFPAFSGAGRPSTLGYDSIAARPTDGHAVPAGYHTRVLLKSMPDDDTAIGQAPEIIGYLPLADKPGPKGLLLLSDRAGGVAPMVVEVSGAPWRAETTRYLGTAGDGRRGIVTPWRTLLMSGAGGWASERDIDAGPEAPHQGLGALHHHGLGALANRDGRLVFYFCDGGPDGYLYRFVSHAKQAPLLASGTLSAARFMADGTLIWRPLIWGTGTLTADNGFDDALSVQSQAARAAGVVGATVIGGASDVTTNPINDRVYVLSRFGAAAPARMIEIAAPGADHSIDRFDWDNLPLDDQNREAEGSTVDTPNRIATDPTGRLWIAAEAGARNGPPSGNGLHACDVDGPGRALTRLFFRAPRGTTLSAPVFTPDGTAMFVAIRHDAGCSAPDGPAWPDFVAGTPPRAAIVVVTRDDGGLIGS